jgi:hypothetical protein
VGLQWLCQAKGLPWHPAVLLNYLARHGKQRLSAATVAGLSSGGGGEKWVGGCRDGPFIGGEVRVGAEQCPIAGAE